MTNTVTKLARMQGLGILGSIRKPLTMEALTNALGRGSPEQTRPQSKVVLDPAMPSLLDAAIERGALHPFFQAKVSMASGRIVGAEALARIAVSEKSYTNPVPYIELAERREKDERFVFGWFLQRVKL